MEYIHFSLSNSSFSGDNFAYISNAGNVNNKYSQPMFLPIFVFANIFLESKFRFQLIVGKIIVCYPFKDNAPSVQYILSLIILLIKPTGYPGSDDLNYFIRKQSPNFVQQCKVSDVFMLWMGIIPIKRNIFTTPMLLIYMYTTPI